MRQSALTLLGLAAFGASIGLDARALEIDPSTRTASLLFYHENYASVNVAMGWVGDYAACDAGTTSPEWRQAIIDQVNFYRAMAGVPANVALNPDWNAKAQQAAMLMSVNEQLSHTPSPNWECYTTDGALAAGKSNLAQNVTGVLAVNGYMRDPRSSNYFVGHRRYILYPQTDEMGAGDVPGIPFVADPINALWVVDDNSFSDPRPPTREPYVAWPPPGFVPAPIVPAQWSFSYPNANFDSATITMTENGAAIPVKKNQILNGYGENTVVWVPNNLSVDFGWPPLPHDANYEVTISNVMIDDQVQSFSYSLTIFDPTVLLADFNGNRVVNAADLATLVNNFGRAGATIAQGDANRDGVVDGADVMVWQREAGVDLTAAAPAATPEPSAWMCGATAATALWAAQRRRRG